MVKASEGPIARRAIVFVSLEQLGDRMPQQLMH
jgi:hypothetical protein